MHIEMSKFLFPALSTLLLSFIGAATNAASFDCKLAHGKVETMICADSGLSKLDERLSAIYSQSRKTSSDERAGKAMQLAWLKTRNACDDVACLLRLYETRIDELRTTPASASPVVNTAPAAPLVSYFPKKDLGRFLANKFDLASIRSSFGPRRTPAQRTFADLGMRPSKATDDVVVFESPGDWLYELKIVGRGDVNSDGIEDLVVCFIDRALNGGTYDTAEGLLITRYAADSYALALSFSVEAGVCENYAR